MWGHTARALIPRWAATEQDAVRRDDPSVWQRAKGAEDSHRATRHQGHIAEVALHPGGAHITDRTDLEARELRPGRVAFATAGSLFYVASGVTWQVRR